MKEQTFQEYCDRVRQLEKRVKALEQNPTIEAYEQVCKERDIAIEQLHELGYEWGQKIEPCDDVVSRQWLMRKATERFYTTNYFNHITKMIEEAPSVRPQEQTGHWIRQDNTKEPLYGWYFCSECNSVIGDKTKFCSNCGANMVEPQERNGEE